MPLVPISSGIDVALSHDGVIGRSEFFVHPILFQGEYPGWVFYAMDMAPLKRIIMALPQNYRTWLIGKREREEERGGGEAAERVFKTYAEEPPDEDGSEYTLDPEQAMMRREEDIEGIIAMNDWRPNAEGLTTKHKGEKGGAPYYVLWVHASAVPAVIRSIIAHTTFKTPVVQDIDRAKELQKIFTVWDKNESQAGARERPPTVHEAGVYYEDVALNLGLVEATSKTRTKAGEKAKRSAVWAWKLYIIYGLWRTVEQKLSGVQLIQAQRYFARLLAQRYVSVKSNPSHSDIEDENNSLSDSEKDAVFVYVVWILQERCRDKSVGARPFGKDRGVEVCIAKELAELAVQHEARGNSTKWDQRQLAMLAGRG